MFDTCTLDIMRSAVFNGMHMSFPFVWGLMAGLRCCVSHGGITST